MKKLLVLLFCGLLAVACSKDDGNGIFPDKDKYLPQLPDPNDVCSGMDDIAFMQYCYDNFDVNKDGKVSMLEASAVTEIMARDIQSFKGIEHSQNLESFRCRYCGMSIIDLSRNLKIKTLTTWAFADCHSLTSVKLPSSVEIIEVNAFRGCPMLATIRIPENVTMMGSAFIACGNLYGIYLSPQKPPILDMSTSEFTECSSWLKIYVPTESVDAYKTAPGWCDLKYPILGYDF